MSKKVTVNAQFKDENNETQSAYMEVSNNNRWAEASEKVEESGGRLQSITNAEICDKSQRIRRGQG